MPRPRKGARLVLRKDRKELVWVIRDRDTYVRTNCKEGEYDKAEIALRDYLSGSFKPQTIGEAIGIGVIYYVSVAGSETYPIKIGYTSGSVSSRIDGMQTGNPNVLVCLATERGTLRDEIDRHRRFRPYHFRNEWFARGKPLMQHIASLPGNVVVHFEVEEVLAEQRAINGRALSNEGVLHELNPNELQ